MSPVRKHVAFQKERSLTPRTPSPRGDNLDNRKRARISSPEKEDIRKRNSSDHENRKRENDSKKRRLNSKERGDPHTKWKPTESKPYQAGLEELFEPSYGSKAVII